MKRTTTTVFAALLLSLLATGAAFAQFAPIKDGDKLDAVIGVVGKHPILKSAIDAQVQMYFYQRNITNPNPDSVSKVRQQVLQAEIDQKVWLARADQDSLVVSDQQVDERLDQLIKGYIQRAGSEQAVEKSLGKSIAEIKASPDLRERTRENLLVTEEQQKLMPAQPSVSKADVEEFYRIYKDSLPTVGPQAELATIVKLIKPLPNQKERSKNFATSLLDSLKHGADFANLARRYSQHSTAVSGGDLGAFYPRGTFLPAFEEAAFKLKPGEISDVVETEQGFHIIKLVERRGEEIHVAQILIKPTVNSLDEQIVRDSLLTIRTRAIAGEDFGKLAQQYSDDPETRVFGGSLGHIRVEDLAPEQRSVVDSLKDGEISMPLHIGYAGGLTGFQIVKLVRKIPAHPFSLTDDYRDLEATAVNWKTSREFQKLLANARKAVYMQINDLSKYY